MHRSQTERALESLNNELRQRGLRGEMCLYGGAVMCLLYHARPDTKDVDAVFRPTTEIRELARSVAEQENLPSDWLNDAVKGYVVHHGKRVHRRFSNLLVFIPEPRYLLAMKAMAARFDSADGEDVRFLIRRLDLKSAEDVLEIVREYYPDHRIRPATRYFVEEIFQS